MKALKSRLSKEQQDLQSKFAPLLQNKTCFSATFGRITPRITKHILKVSNILTPPPPTNGKCLVTHLKGSGVTHLGAFLYHRFPSPVFTGSDADKKAQKTKRLGIAHKLVRKGRRPQFDGRQTIQLCNSIMHKLFSWWYFRETFRQSHTPSQNLRSPVWCFFIFEAVFRIHLWGLKSVMDVIRT